MSEEKQAEPLPANILRSTVSKNVNNKDAGGRWSWETKQEVVEKYLILGNMQLVSALTGVDRSLIQSWKKQDWWKELVDTYRGEQAVKLDSNMSRVVDKALAVVEDRLENGEKILNNKTGEIVSKPVSMKDAGSIARDLLVRQTVIRKDESEIVQHKETTKDVLAALAKEFAKWSGKKNTEPVEDIEYVERTDETSSS